MKKTGLVSNALIWFGAAVSIAEIKAGVDLGGNWSALLAGHLFGGLMLFVVGLFALAGLTDHFFGFLCFISSVFAPMASVLVVDRYLVKRGVAWWNLAAWLIGVATYHLASASPIGPTLTAVLASALVASLRLRRAK